MCFDVKHEKSGMKKPSFFIEKDIQLVPTVYDIINNNLKKIEEILQEQEIEGTKKEKEMNRVYSQYYLY